jgi:hypothetical protein
MTPDPDPTAGRLAELERLARAATPGPWERETDSDGNATPYLVMAGDIRISDTGWDVGKKQAGRNTAFIAAAHPGTVLALVERVRELEAENSRLHVASAEDRGTILDLEDENARLRALPAPEARP